MSNQVKKDCRTLMAVIVSAFVYAVAMKAFVETGNLFPGGFAGLSRLFSQSLSRFGNIEIPFSVFYFVLNIPPTLLVFKYVGKRFTIFSVLQYTLTSLFTELLPTFPITDDMLLIAVFGGIVGGLGIAIALRSDASSGGTDFIAIYASSKYNAPTWSYVMYFNAAMLILAGILFGWERALYSIIYQFCSTQVVSTMHMRFKLNSLFIITEKPEEVCDAVFHYCRHGITKLWGEGGFSHTPRCLLFMTVNAYQVHGLIETIRKVDSKVFINVSKTDKIIGNYYQKPLD